jgi:Signal transduction histidine kinase regulating C4-dicarboxylate transport system
MQTIPPQPDPTVNTFLPLNEGKKERILIVEDSVTVRKVFVKHLSARYECFEAESAAQALALLAEREFALVLTDVIMPGLSGVELLRKVVEKYPNTAVIILSGVNNPQRALDALRLGAFDYLIKPCDLHVVEFTIERALERRELLLNAIRYKRDLEARNAELARGKAALERLQAQIVHSEKMASLGQLAAGIAHELNNPVGFIYGNLDILGQCIAELKKLLNYYDRSALPAEIAEGARRLKEEIDYAATLKDLDSIIADCQDGAQRICDIVQNLKIFSRLDEAEFAQTDIHEGIESTLRLLSRYYRADNIRLHRDYGDLPLVEAYSGQLNQVWMNLLANAAQALGAKGGDVSISTRVQGDSVVVIISDNGCGIPPEHLNRVFDPFFTTKPVGEGTGLGLSISFGIVKRHGGTIEVRSQPNRGSSFIVRLPIHAKNAPSGEFLLTNTENN